MFCGVSIARETSTNITLEISVKFASTGLEIATDTVASATKTFNLATKTSSLVTTLATMNN